MKKRMPFLLLLLSCLVGKAFAQDTIYWSPGYKLQWTDFKGTPDNTVEYAAITESGIAYSYSYTGTSFTFKVVAFFAKYKSWKTEKVNSNTLKHEQGHFDITEIFAQKLKTELKKLIPKRITLENDMAILFKKILSEKEEMQKRYDAETQFGTNQVIQVKWLDKIHEQLVSSNAGEDMK